MLTLEPHTRAVTGPCCLSDSTWDALTAAATASQRRAMTMGRRRHVYDAPATFRFGPRGVGAGAGVLLARGGLRGGRGADRAADGRGATSLDASSRDASFRGRDGGRRGGDGEGGHAHAGCSTSVRRSEATDSRVSAGASGAEQRPRASTPDCRMSISAVYLWF